VAVAKGNSPANAQAAADGFVDSLMPSAGSTQGICETKTQSGFFAKNASYLASCATADGTFQAFFIVGAKNGSLHTKSSYVGSQLATFCATGHAYSVGVKEKLAAIYAGTGANVTIAKDFRDLLASEIKKSTPGYVKPFTLC
jgi:hypothetical protein